ncbi:uncharacterized protein FTOL_07909 [Fusarium torulosum]|uniref:BTB domain-containing protein n=1 Tax=Fusarium torulosum TaxID=33205 RepID=A0AAE8MCN5_9HYPO|nr:uncharacterized protein FTOL_07909 [Fusarium torulosum]
MSTPRTPFNSSAGDFKPYQADKRAMQDDAKARPGTCDKHKGPLPERSDNDSSTWRSSILQEGFGNASLEEHRLKDYSQGKGRLGVIGDATFQRSAAPSVGFPASVSSADKKKLDLLRGSGIDIHVGTSALPCDQWSLPLNFISHYSPYLKAASTSNDEGPHKRINLPEHDPAVFGLFVEWMYYGSYNAISMAPDPHIHAKCWILGDKLECPEFKNYVMGLLYTQHITSPFAKNVTYEEVEYVCDNTSSSAKLRQYYENFVVRHYATPGKLPGSTEAWDALFQKHSEMRIALLQSMRDNFAGGNLMKDIVEYLESTEGRKRKGKKEKEEQKESQTSVDGKAPDEVHEGASSMHHVPKVEAGSPSTIITSGQEDTNETLISADPKPESKRRKTARQRAKRHLVNETPELSARDDNDSLSEHEPEQVRTEQAEAEATPEPAKDEGNASTDSEQIALQTSSKPIGRGRR